jgi:hypothetical protein
MGDNIKVDVKENALRFGLDSPASGYGAMERRLW